MMGSELGTIDGDKVVKKKWDLSMTFDPKQRCIVLKVTEQKTKQQFGKDIKKGDVNGKEIVSAYQELMGEINSGNVKYEYKSNPPLIVTIGNYTFSCPQM